MRHLLCILVLGLALLAGACDEVTTPARPDDTGDCAGPALAARDDDCTDLSDFLHTVGLLDTPGDAAAVAEAGGTLCVADGDGGLVLVDACDPARLTAVATLALPGPALGVDATPRYAYVAAGTAGLIVVDIGDPDRPVIVGRLPSAGAARDVHVVESAVDRGRRRALAYVADDAVGLVIADVTNPGRPVVLGIENTAGEARGVFVDGDVAYVADAGLGLRVVPVNDPGNPWLLRAVDIPGEATAVAVWRDLAVVAAGSAGAVVVDVSAPAAAVVTGTYDTADRADDVAVVDGFAFVADRGAGTIVIDVSHPAAPARVGRSGGEGFATGVAASGHVVFTADGFAGVRAVDARTPWNPPHLARLLPGGGDASVIVARGNRFFVGDRNLGLYIGEWRGDHFARRGDLAYAVVHNITFQEDLLFLAAGDAGVRMVDVSDPDRPREVLAVPSTMGAIDVAVADSVVFTVRGGTSNPNMVNLRRINDLPVPLSMPGGVVRAVDVGESFAYFVQVQGRLYVTSLDPSVSQPVHWVQLTNGNSVDVHVRGTVPDGGQTLFIANRQGKDGFGAGVEVYDLSSPLMPQFVTLVETSIAPERIAFDGDVMLVAGEGDGLEVIDVADVEHPRIIGAFSRTSPVNSAVAVPGAIITASGTDGLFALPPRCE